MMIDIGDVSFELDSDPKVHMNILRRIASRLDQVMARMEDVTYESCLRNLSPVLRMCLELKPMPRSIIGILLEHVQRHWKKYEQLEEEFISWKDLYDTQVWKSFYGLSGAAVTLYGCLSYEDFPQDTFDHMFPEIYGELIKTIDFLEYCEKHPEQFYWNKSSARVVIMEGVLQQWNEGATGRWPQLMREMITSA